MAAKGREQEGNRSRFVYVTRFGSHQCGGVLQLGGRRALGPWSPGFGAGRRQAGARAVAAGTPGGTEPPAGSRPRSPEASSPARASNVRSRSRPTAGGGATKGWSGTWVGSPGLSVLLGSRPARTTGLREVGFSACGLPISTRSTSHASWPSGVRGSWSRVGLCSRTGSAPARSRSTVGRPLGGAGRWAVFLFVPGGAGETGSVLRFGALPREGAKVNDWGPWVGPLSL